MEEVGLIIKKKPRCHRETGRLTV